MIKYWNGIHGTDSPKAIVTRIEPGDTVRMRRGLFIRRRIQRNGIRRTECISLIKRRRMVNGKRITVYVERHPLWMEDRPCKLPLATQKELMKMAARIERTIK